MKKKSFITAGISMGMSLIMSITSFAAGWEQDSIGWWWRNDDGSYPVSTWEWLDGNSDGIAECYYFSPVGYCLLNATTPDGYQVNENGAWIVNGSVQTKIADVIPETIPGSSETPEEEPPKEEPETETVTVNLYDGYITEGHLYDSYKNVTVGQYDIFWSNVHRIRSTGFVKYSLPASEGTLTMTVGCPYYGGILKIYDENDNLLRTIILGGAGSPRQADVIFGASIDIKNSNSITIRGSFDDCYIRDYPTFTYEKPVQ